MNVKYIEEDGIFDLEVGEIYNVIVWDKNSYKIGNGWYNKDSFEVVKENDMSNVEHPNHYNQGQYEVIDVINDWDLNFNLGNAIKYIARAEHKNNYKEDIEKAIFYLKYELSHLE